MGERFSAGILCAHPHHRPGLKHHRLGSEPAPRQELKQSKLEPRLQPARTRWRGAHCSEWPVKAVIGMIHLKADFAGLNPVMHVTGKAQPDSPVRIADQGSRLDVMALLRPAEVTTSTGTVGLRTQPVRRDDDARNGVPNRINHLQDNLRGGIGDQRR